MAQTILGIDLGSYSVKIAQVERGFGEFKLTNFFEVPLVGEEILSYHQAASAALAKFFSENPLVYDSCIVSLPGNMVSFRVFDLPFSNVGKIDQTIEFELETLIPFEIEDVLFDYSILDRKENSTKVLVTYVLEENFKRFLTQIQGSQMDPRYMGVDTLDLSYLTTLGVLPPEGRYAILDLGHSKANFLILDGNRVRGVRTFSWGGDSITRAIAEAASLSYEAAENLKHSRGQIVSESEDPALQAITKSFEDLAQQIKQTLFAFYESGETPIEALYLSGGTSRMIGADSFFSQKLNINIGMLDVLEDAYTDLPGRETTRPIAPTAFASALHGVFPNKGMKINFRQGEYAYKRDIEEMGGTLKKIGVMAATVVGIGILYFFISYMMLSSQVNTLNKNISNLIRSSVTDLPKKGVASTKSALSILNGKISGLDEKLKKVEGDSSLSALRILQTVSAAMPPRDQLKVDIDDINISPQRVRFEGRTSSYEGVDKVKSSMEKVAIFKNVQTGNVRKGVRDEIKFSLSFDVVGGQDNI